MNIEYWWKGRVMIDRSDMWKSLLSRFLMGCPFLVGAYFMFKSGGVPSILGVFVVLPFAYLIAEPITALLSNRITIFHPEKKRERTPIFGHAEKLINLGELDEAEKVYSEFADEFPTNPDVYIGMIKLAVEYREDIDMARIALRRGLSNITAKKDRAFLLKNFRLLSKRLLKTPADDLENENEWNEPC